MTKLIIIRHGQSVSNIKGVFTGNLDLPLTELGLTQARTTASYILEHYTVDAVYASDLCRAVDTAKAVAEPCGLTVKTDRRLREIYAGRWEGRSFNELTEHFPAYAVWRSDIGRCVTDGGESVSQLSARVLEAFRQIAAENDGKTVVIATHATPIRALQCYCKGKPAEQMKDIPWVTNASFSTITCDRGIFRLEVACHDAHLGDIVTRFPSNV